MNSTAYESSMKQSVAPNCRCRFLVLPSVTLSINTAFATSRLRWKTQKQQHNRLLSPGTHRHPCCKLCGTCAVCNGSYRGSRRNGNPTTSWRRCSVRPNMTSIDSARKSNRTNPAVGFEKKGFALIRSREAMIRLKIPIVTNRNKRMYTIMMTPPRSSKDQWNLEAESILPGLALASGQSNYGILRRSFSSVRRRAISGVPS